MCHLLGLRKQTLVILFVSIDLDLSIDLDPRPTQSSSSGTKSMLNTLGWCLDLGQLAEFSEKAISEVRYYLAKKEERKKKSEVLFCTILKNRSWGTAIWRKCLSMVLSRARYEFLHLRRHPFSHRLTCPLPSRRALMLPIRAATLSMLSTRKGRGVGAAVNRDSVYLKAQKMFICPDLPQFLLLCSSEWVQSSKSIREFKSVLLGKYIRKLK